MTSRKLTSNDLKMFSLGLGTTQRWFLPLFQVNSQSNQARKKKASTWVKKKLPSYSQVILYTKNFKDSNKTLLELTNKLS